MASENRRSPRHLIDEIREDGSRFRFFQAVRLLALDASGGVDCDPISSRLRFTSQLSLAFQASEIAQVTHRVRGPGIATSTPHDVRDTASIPPKSADHRDSHLDMEVGFMGLTGPSGVLPIPYTELLIDQRNQHRDETGHRFLDLFTHRAVSLFYRAWRKHRFYLQYEAGDTEGFTRNLLDLVGVGLQHLQRRLQGNGGGIPDRFLIHYSGLLAQKPISSTSIAALVHGYFGVDAQLESYVGQWMQLPHHEQSALDGRPCQLGRNAFIGERLWDRQTKVCLRLGPLNQDQFAQFMPGQAGLVALRELIQFCVGFTLDCEVALVLKHQAVPRPVLTNNSLLLPRLGYNLWLNSEQARHDVDDARFTLL